MSTTIDNRVVKMTFDNAQFERGVKETMKTLDNFEKKLNLDGATAGFDKVKKAADNLNLSATETKADKIKSKFGELSESVSDSFSNITKAANNTDLSGISSNAQTAINNTQNAIDGLDAGSITTEMSAASEGFNAFQIVAVGALLAVGDQITNFVTGGLNKLVSGITGLANSAIWQPIKDGFAEYETQMGAIQTIMANTGRDFNSSQDIADVNSALDTLNTYADKTIYNFTEMTRNIGTFTAAGIQMEDAVPAIQGIANLAALSGSTSHQASTAMYQLSQALAAGTVKLMDWNSVVNAGMGGKVFQNKLLETAQHIHAVNGEMDIYGGTIQGVIDGQVSFRDSLQDGWITSEVLTEALQQMTYSYDDMTTAEVAAAKAHLESLGYTSEEIEAVFQLGKTAMESATKVRTWSQLWETVGEALGSGWTTTWRTIIGDFQEATNLFTYISQKITGVVDSISNARNAVLEGWAQFQGRDFLFGTWVEDPNGGLPTLVMNGALQNFVDMLNGWAQPVADAFEGIFDLFDEDFLERHGITEENGYNADYARMLKTNYDEAQKYREEALNELEGDAVRYDAVRAEFDRTDQYFKEGWFDGVDPKTFLFDEVGHSLASITEGFKNFTATLIPSQTAIDGIRGVFVGLFSTLETVMTAIGALINGFSGVVTTLRIFIDPIIDIIFTLAGSIGLIVATIATHLTEIINSIVEFGDNTFGQFIPALKGIVDGFLGFIDIPGKIQAVTDVITTFIDFVFQMVNIPAILSTVGGAFSTVFNGIAKFFGIINDEEGEAAKTWDNLGTRITNKLKDIGKAIIDTIPFLGTIVGWFKNLFSVFQNGGENGLQIFVNKTLMDLRERLGFIIDPLERLVDAVKNFAKSFVESFWELDIVKDAQKAISDFSVDARKNFDKVIERVKFFATIVGGVFKSLFDSLHIPDKINDLTNYFTNLTPQKAIDDIKQFGKNIQDNINNTIDFISNTKPSDMRKGFFAWLNDSLTNTDEFVDNAINQLKTKFPQFSEQLDNAHVAIENGMTGIANALSTILGPAFQESETFPELILNIFKRIGIAIREGIRGIIDDIANIKISDMFNFITTPLQGLLDWLTTTFPSLSRYLDPVKNTFKDLSKSLEDSGKTIGDVIGDAFSRLRSAIEEHAPFIIDIVNGVGDVFNNLPDSIKTAAKFISNILSNLPGAIGGAFGFLSNAITGFSLISKLESVNIPEFFNNMFNGMQNPIEGVKNALGEFVDSFSQQDVEQSTDDFGNDVVTSLEDSFETIKEYIMSLPDKLGELVKNVFGEEGPIKAVIDRMSNAVGTLLMFQIGSFVRNLGVTMKNLSKAVKGAKTDSIGDQILKMGKAIAMVGIVIGILSQMKVEDIIKGGIVVIAIGGFISGLNLLNGFFAKFQNVDTKQGSKALLRTAEALGIIVALVAITSIIPIDQLGKGAIVLGAATLFIEAVVGFSGWVAKSKALDIEKGSKALLKVAKSLLIIAAACLVIAPAFVILSNVLMGEQGFDFGKLASLGIAIAAIAGLVAGLKILADQTKGLDLIATSVSLIAFAGALMLLGFALIPITELDANKLFVSSLAIGVLIAALGALAHFTNAGDLALSAAALVLFGGGLLAMSVGLSELAKLDSNKLFVAGIALSLLVGVFGAFSLVLSGVGPIALGVLPLFAVALVGVGVAARLVAEGLDIAIDAVIRLAEHKDVLVSFVQAIAGNLLAFGGAALAFIALGGALVTLSIGVGIFGVASLAAAGGIFALTMALNAFLEFAQRVQEFIDAGSNITAGIGQGISSGVDGAIGAIMGIGQAILGAILSFFGIASPSTVMAEQVGQYLPAGIAEGIDNNSGSLMDSLGGTLGELLNNFTTWVQTEGLPKLQEFGNNILDKVKNEIIPNLLDWVENEGIPKLGEMAQGVIDHIMEELGKMPGKLMEWAASLPGKIWEGIQSAWGTITSIGQDIMNGIVEGIKSMPGAISDAIVGMASGGLDAIKSFFGIKSPSTVMRDQVGRWIPAGLAEGIDEYSKIAVNQSERMAKDVMSGVKNNIDIIDTDFGLNFGTVTPVLDMSAMDTAIGNYSKQWSGMDFTRLNNNMQNINANIDLTSMLRSSMDQTSEIASLRSQNEGLLSEIAALRGEIAGYNESIMNTAIVMDSGTLVGELTPGIDSELGRRQSMARRGVIQ